MRINKEKVYHSIIFPKNKFRESLSLFYKSKNLVKGITRKLTTESGATEFIIIKKNLQIVLNKELR